MSRVFWRALAIWAILMGAEAIHGTLRVLLLAPVVGDFRARQICVFTGAPIIFFLSYCFVRWIGARTTKSLLLIGLEWLILTLGFEFALGRFGFGFSYERILSDYNLLRGGLLPIGLLLMTLSPLLSACWRGLK